MRRRSTVDPFNEDVDAADGYRYTLADGLSTRLVRQRITSLVWGSGLLRDRRVVDVGCGDGYFTRAYAEMGSGPILGVDPAERAIAVASRAEGKGTSFAVADGEALPLADDAADVVLLQGVLHHAASPRRLLRESFRVAPRVIIYEPNGLNPLLKVIEQVSPYHRAHEERSFSRGALVRWIGDAGGRVEVARYAGFVPIFSPDWVARLALRLEGPLERSPLAPIACAVQFLVARRA